MSVSIDWGTKVITVPRTYMTLVQSSPSEIRELPLNQFRLDLKALEAAAEGMPHLVTHRHNTEVLLGGIVYARTIEIINGYTVTFEDGQYAVNLTGANSNVGDVVNLNQVSVRSQNAAGLISNSAIEYSSFEGFVTIDATTSNIGTVYPTGTAQRPVNNLADAKLIASVRGLSKLRIIGDFTFGVTDIIEDFEIYGTGLQSTHIFCISGSQLVHCEMFETEVEGETSGLVGITNAFIHEMHFDETATDDETIYLSECLLEGEITMPEVYTGDLKVVNCYSNVAGAGTPTFNFNNCESDAIFRGWTGGIALSAATTGNLISMDLHSGNIRALSSNTDAFINCRGIGTIVDEATGSTTFNTEGLISNQAIEYASFDGFVTINQSLSNGNGTRFPFGTPQQPVNNLTDAVTIAETRGITKFSIVGTFVIGLSDMVEDYEFWGQGLQSTHMTMISGSQLIHCELYDMNLNGETSGLVGITNAFIYDLHFDETATDTEDIYLKECLIEGEIDMPEVYTGQLNVIDCYSHVPNTINSPSFNFNNCESDAIIRNWSGAIAISAVSQGNDICMDLISGSINILSSCSDGELTSRGVGLMTDNSQDGMIVSKSGLVSEVAIEYASYEGFVTINTALTGNTGTVFPVGTAQAPVSNLADAILIAEDRGFTKLRFYSDFTFLSSVFISDYEIWGTGQQNTNFTFDAGSALVRCDFHECRMTGTITGFIGATDVLLDNLGSVSPIPVSQDVIIENCLINGTLTIPALYSGSLKAINCYSNVAGTDTPILDMGDSTGSCIMRNWSGGIELANVSMNNDISIDLVSGTVSLLSTVSDGDIVIRGTGILSDSSLSGATVNTDGLLNRDSIALAQASDFGFAQGAGNGVNQIQLRADASSSNAAYDPSMIIIRDGTGAGQGRMVYNYDGTTKIATVDRNWKIVPDTTSYYAVMPNPGREHVNEGLVVSATLSSVELNAAASDSDEDYTGQTIFLRSGTGEDQVRSVLAYDGATHIATVDDWFVTPDTTTAYVMLPQSSGSTGGGSSDWTLSEKSQIRSALGVNGSKVAAVSGQLQENTVATKVAAMNAEETNLKIQ